MNPIENQGKRVIVMLGDAVVIDRPMPVANVTLDDGRGCQRTRLRSRAHKFRWNRRLRIWACARRDCGVGHKHVGTN